MTLLTRQGSAEGFLVPQFGGQFPQGIQQMAQWIKEGKLIYREDILEGLEDTPTARPKCTLTVAHARIGRADAWMGKRCRTDPTPASGTAPSDEPAAD